MKFYVIVPGEEKLPSNNLLKRLKSVGQVVIIKHTGALSKITQLMNDKSDKIIGVDPDSFSWNLDTESIKNIPNIKAVCTSTTSFDWIKPKILKELGVIGSNCPGFSVDSVAEYALSMAIEVARHAPLVVKNEWKYTCKQAVMPFLLKGKTAGIIGLGRIGTRMAELCKGIGMDVLYWSRKSRDKRFKKTDINELLKKSDIIMPALAENDQTRKILTNKRLDLMKKTACLIGINRVCVVWDQKYVLNKAAKGEIGGYAFEVEGAKSPRFYKGNVWSLPAMAWYTQDSIDNLMEIFVNNMIAIAKGKPQNRVA